MVWSNLSLKDVDGRMRYRHKQQFVHKMYNVIIPTQKNWYQSSLYAE